MRKSKYSEEQIIGFLRQAEAGMPVAEICRKGGRRAARGLASGTPEPVVFCVPCGLRRDKSAIEPDLASVGVWTGGLNLFAPFDVE